MGVFTTYETSDNKHEKDTLRMVFNKSHTEFKGVLSTIKMIDKDTSQHIIYIPSLNLTSYGDTEEQAEEMMKSSIDDLFEFLDEMPPKQRELELRKMGWEQNKLKNKIYSKAYVDPSGVLQNFNVTEQKVERLSLVAD